MRALSDSAIDSTHRCDASIVKLSVDPLRIYEGIQSHSSEQQRAKVTLEGKIKDVEGRLNKIQYILFDESMYKLKFSVSDFPIAVLH